MPPALLSLFDVEPTRIGGLEVFCRELSSRLQERGWNSVLCFAAPPTDAVRGYLDLPNISFEVLDNSRPFYWRTAVNLTTILRRVRPRILHIYFVGFLNPYPLVARVCGLKRIYFTDQGSHPEGYVPERRSWWKRLLARALHRPLTRVFCISDFNVRMMLAHDLVPASKVQQLYNSVDLSVPVGNGPTFRRTHGIPEGRQIIAQVSWIIPEKGIEDLLQAARIVIAQCPTAHFVIVGEGTYRDKFTRKAIDLGIEDHLTWTGKLENPLAEGVYTAAEICCQVSRWQEAFGWVIAEAMACRRPVVATSVGGIPELVHDGKSGFLIPPRNPAALAEKIMTLLRDPALRERMGAEGRRIAEEHFELHRNVAELIRNYGL